MLASLLLAGFYVNIAEIPVWVRWLHYLGHLKYGFDAEIINEFQGSEVEQDLDFSSIFDPPNGTSVINGTVIPLYGEDILENGDFEFVVDTIWGNILILIGFAFAYRFITYWVLRFSFKQKG